MKKGLIIQGIKMKTSVSVFVSTLFYVFLASFFIEGGLWLSSELVGPFSIAIGYLTEFFSPGNGVASIQEFFFHYILYYELFSFVFILLLFIFWVKVIEKNSLSSLGFVKKNWLKYLGWGILLSLLQMGVIALVYQVGGIGTFELNELSLEPILFILGLFPFWLLQGGTEEVATRGWLLTRIAARTNLPLAIAISSSLFGILHLGNSGVTVLSVLNIVLDGVLAGLLFIYTDSIWLVVAQHGTWNYVQGNLLGFQVSGTGADASIFSFTMGTGPDWLTGGEFGAEGSIITTLVLLLSVLIVYLLGERNERTVE
ncbi:MAG: CPBP family intramembrane glutamic endopeptidase [Streptococcus parasanguinis]|uniref:CPBP family intramembrane glutamic endopeptidase n=1 Tax=Streptococcus parasanguinis TaxID=1318 RepID=UPI00066A461D|nr:CPBP family intramembrane glutamic endopeptidase [Streptococcus parasanguinis]MBZ2090400.1 CPBP family intramembrane metalloprotease [Streptococcus parasanguinis]MDU3000589.1 CPBP family intramembrane glutamic endopeptidase [Streptococcus parasanguinis]MDU4887410.1 CPBP family intramembrane glutamic endopeptidase [Streptococcus parasanguinis]MDU5786930.1 CPBP family intramembrane glutamic endopeptidase [Streptococcus parasanguinis]